MARMSRTLPGRYRRKPHGRSQVPVSFGGDGRWGLAYLRDQGADPVVLASQSMAAVADSEAPLIDPLPLAAAAAAGVSKTGRIGLVASRATVASGTYTRLVRSLRPDAAVYAAAAPLLVPLLDAGWQRRPETRMIVKKVLHRLRVRQVDTLILGSSRFTALKRMIQRKIGLRVQLVDPLACALEAVAAPAPPSSEGAAAAWPRRPACRGDRSDSRGRRHGAGVPGTPGDRRRGPSLISRVPYTWAPRSAGCWKGSPG